MLSMPAVGVEAPPIFQKEVPIQLPSLDNIAKLRIGIIRTSWNDSLVSSLTEQCKQVLFHSPLRYPSSVFVLTSVQAMLSSGVAAENIVADMYDVPGAYELPFSALRLATSGKVDAIVS